MLTGSQIQIIHYQFPKKKVLFALITVQFYLFINFCPAQETNVLSDSTDQRKFNPRTAIICSMLVPGLGQVYNQKYWKVPLIYGAGIAMVYAFNYNQSKYTEFRKALAEDDPQKIYIIDGYQRTYDQLKIGRDWYRRYRDLSLLGIAIVYFLNVVDAMVDAYFTGFDVSDDLSLKIEPAVVDNFGLTASVGLKFTIGF
ncbi:MAG: hypothetical protein JW973_01645 [Bacteroidales bacterium]|nr:hypothetical protein [Bacteroidales bacterium]